MKPIRLFGVVLVAFAFACAGPRATTTPAADNRSERVVAALVPVVHVKGEPESRYRIDDRMKHFHTSGVSIAVADGGVIVWARGFGVVERGKDAPITNATLFQAASISKPITATATLRLAEQGKISLDEDVNQYLRSWKLPDSDLTAKEKVTLRRIVSHTAGTNVHGFAGYPPGDPLPTVPQILDGAPPANTPPVRVTSVPGSKLEYSGGGVTIEQLLLCDVTHQTFPALMKELVLDPAGMRDSTFDPPLPARISTGHDASGAPMPGGFRVQPELAAAGLWSTPSDLLAWSIAIADARAGRSSNLLTQSSAQAMLTPVKGPVGLGPFVRGSGRALRFGHPGTNYGYHSELVYFPELGKGAAVMVNGDSGRPMLREILYAIAAEYGWPDFVPDTIDSFPIDPQTRLLLPGTYEGKFVERVVVDARIHAEGDTLHFESKRLGLSSPMIFTSKTTFVVEESGDELAFTFTPDGKVEAVHFGDIALFRATLSR